MLDVVVALAGRLPQVVRVRPTRAIQPGSVDVLGPIRFDTAWTSRVRRPRGSVRTTGPGSGHRL